MNSSLPSFQLDIYCGTTLVDIFITDCREDFDEVIAFAQAVKERSRQTRKLAMIEDLPHLKQEIISVKFERGGIEVYAKGFCIV
jgi:hypothetical protein